MSEQHQPVICCRAHALPDEMKARIEAKAAARERERIAEEVRGLHVTSLVGMTGDASVDNYVDRAAVLRAIEET